jgi:hypothetical protein
LWRVTLDVAAALPGSWLFLLSQVRDAMGPLNQWPDGHLIMAASTGPSLERKTNRHRTSAGSPQRLAPSSSR